MHNIMRNGDSFNTLIIKNINIHKCFHMGSQIIFVFMSIFENVIVKHCTHYHKHLHYHQTFNYIHN